MHQDDGGNPPREILTAREDRNCCNCSREVRDLTVRCPLLGVKRTWPRHGGMSPHDPLADIGSTLGPLRQYQRC